MNLNSFTDDDLDDESLDLTSLIDVLFLLLTFFILAATFVPPSLEVDLPTAKTVQSTRLPERELTFSLNSEGDLFHEKNLIDLEVYRNLIKETLEETPIIFNVDQAAPFESFLTLLDEARSLDRHRFMINAQPTGLAPGEILNPSGPEAAVNGAGSDNSSA
ncbi:MAG: biopolymer transporter ExbD [Deltaproteobacteria bacterium]|jgi:biopolymer transport protein ExbD|nr:biopolymer transporter ExbD [Deltaproteobacteria bacterium]